MHQVLSHPCLYAQAAAKGEAREALGRQLQMWQEADFVTHIDKERLNVYQLLAGHIDAVAPQMHLDWRRALGLHFWCANQPTLLCIAVILLCLMVPRSEL